MNKIEKRILKNVIFHVAHHNKYLWWELKRQIWEFGYQTYFPRQGEFELVAERKLMRLGLHEKQALIVEWKKKNINQRDVPDEQIVLSYSGLIIEEIVKRATVGAYLTIHW